MRNDPRFQNMTEEEKVDLINTLDTEAQKKVFSQFHFKYQTEKKATPSTSPYKIKL
ncbi:MAG: hypothetical protein WC346_01290 [Methanogenium sp.]|jgi:hypothetical protein